MQTTLLYQNRRTFFTNFFHFPVKAADTDCQMIGYKTRSQFFFLNMVIDYLSAPPYALASGRRKCEDIPH